MTDLSLANRLSRRRMLARALALGSISPAVAGLLAACNPLGDNDDLDAAQAPTATPQASRQSTATTVPSPTAPEPAATNTTAPTLTPTSAPTSAATATPFPPDPARHFQIVTWAPVISTNPHVGFGWRTWLAARLCLEPLFEFDAELNPVLLLAAEWPAFDNGLLDPKGRWVTWKLRQDVRWHDGESFSADDVIATWRFATDPEGVSQDIQGVTSPFALIEDIERVDDHTVTIRFSAPNPNWIDVFRGGNGVILPAHVFEPLIGTFTDNQDEVNLRPTGTGPWQISEFNVTTSTIRFQRFDDYWDSGKPSFETVEIKGGGDAVSMAERVLRTGDADYAGILDILDPETLRMYADSTTGHFVTEPGTSVETLFINFADPRAVLEERRSEPDTRHPLLSDLRVRRAINLAIPRDRIAEVYGARSVEPIGHPLAAPEAFFGPGLPLAPDMAMARALLDEAGVAGGPLLIQSSVNAVRQAVQEIIAGALEELGFSVEIKAVDAGVFFSSDSENPDTAAHFYADLQIYSMGPGTSPYPLDWAERFRSDRIASSANFWHEPNISRYANPEFDRLHDQAKVEMQPDRQIELWQGMLTILAEDVVVIPLLRRNGLAAVSNRVQPAPFSPWAVAPSWNLRDWTAVP